MSRSFKGLAFFEESFCHGSVSTVGGGARYQVPVLRHFHMCIGNILTAVGGIARGKEIYEMRFGRCYIYKYISLLPKKNKF